MHMRDSKTSAVANVRKHQPPATQWLPHPAWWLVLYVVWATLWPSSVLANGAVAVEVYRGRIGIYEVTVLSRDATPVVSRVVFSIAVLEHSSRQPVEAASITVQATGPEGSIVGPLAAKTGPAIPVHYDVAVPVEVAGVWEFKVTIAGDLRGGQVVFPLEVRDASVDWATVGAILVAVLLFTPAVVAAYRGLRARRQPGPQ